MISCSIFLILKSIDFSVLSQLASHCRTYFGNLRNTSGDKGSGNRKNRRYGWAMAAVRLPGACSELNLYNADFSDDRQRLHFAFGRVYNANNH